MPSFLL